MKKKTYERPEIQVVEMSAADIICTSTVLQNEGYDELDESVTDSWFNN